MPQYSPTFQVICSDVRKGLSRLNDSSVDTVVTSPPYYGQRDYESDIQIGHEKTIEDYVDTLVEIFGAVRRVLRPEGTLWLNLGDKYLNGQLQGLPWRVALALQADGWVLRSDIIWHKPNAMPSAVKNRPTTDHEYIFLLTRSTKDYYYDADAIREPHVTFTNQSRMKGGRKHLGKRGGTPEAGKNRGNPNLHDGRWDQAFHPKGRNKRTVWSMPLSKYRDAHFAVFPESLVEHCVKAGSPPKGVVLDPFCGSGTTGLVSLRIERDFIGIDCSQRYCDMASERLRNQQGQ
ncbi:MAG: site-specific DNA-methyltransferase [Pirellulaceae bacterium]|nr:site-specific DNA-methyltransferase [Pirellulaceae bacterium]